MVTIDSLIQIMLLQFPLHLCIMKTLLLVLLPSPLLCKVYLIVKSQITHLLALVLIEDRQVLAYVTIPIFQMIANSFSKFVIISSYFISMLISITYLIV